MSGETKLVHEGRFVRLVFADGLSINWATYQRPDGTWATNQAQEYADGLSAKMATLAAALEPVLMEIAAAQGGTLLAKEGHPEDAHRIAVSLTEAAGMSRGISTLSLHVGMPAALTDEQRERVLDCTSEIWDGGQRTINRDLGTPPWQVLPHLGPRSSAWRTGKGAEVMARWSKAYNRMLKDRCVDYRANHPAPFYWFWFYWRPHETRSMFIPVLALITLPWRWWDHRAHRRRAGAPPPAPPLAS
jgi:hypothetical protein